MGSSEDKGIPSEGSAEAATAVPPAPSSLAQEQEKPEQLVEEEELHHHDHHAKDTTATTTTDPNPAQKAFQTAKQHYDSSDAFNFYTSIWGGNLIHIGHYDAHLFRTHPTPSVEQVRAASEHSLERLLEACPDLTAQSRVLDMGGAYAGAARYIAKTYGCHVTSVDISAKACERARCLNREQGMEGLVEVLERSFTDTLKQDGSVDLVLSQDSFLHAGPAREGAVREAARILKVGGMLVFTDIMQEEEKEQGHERDDGNASDSTMASVYRRLSLTNLASIRTYLNSTPPLGLTLQTYTDLTPHLLTHFRTITAVLEQQQHDDGLQVSKPYVSNMLGGLKAWVRAAVEGGLKYGMFVFRKTGGE